MFILFSDRKTFSAIFNSLIVFSWSRKLPLFLILSFHFRKIVFNISFKNGIR